jgi:predicted dehydrogenase
MVIGVGFLGAGPAVQAIHLPTLARLGESFRVAAVMDVNPETAQAIAGRAGARWTTSADDVMGDPQVDVVAVCSPSQFHASQVVAAIESGKKAILCEKPFATSRTEAEKLAEVSRDSGVPIVVGAMHTFDPGWTWVAPDVEQLVGVRRVRSTIVIPPNAHFEELATQIHSRGPLPATAGDGPAAHAARLRGSILGLAIHDLPLIRTVAPSISRVLSAQRLTPFGYVITYLAGDTVVELVAHVHEHRKQEWTLDIVAEQADVLVEFSPSYVHAGSAVVHVTRDGVVQTRPRSNSDGYLREWEHIAALCDGAIQETAELDNAIADLEYAIDLAEAVTEHVMEVAA